MRRSGDRWRSEGQSQRRGIVRPHYLRDTLALSASFFFCLLVNYLVILLLPAVLTSPGNGFSQPEASRALRVIRTSGASRERFSARS